MKRLIVVLVALLVLTGCNSSGEPLHGETIALDYGNLHYYHDAVHGVGIWVYSNGYQGGVSVLPDGQYANPGQPIRTEVK